MLTNKKILAVALAAAAALGLAVARKPSRPTGPTMLAPAPDFRLADLGGQIVGLSSYRGRVVLLNFWASWCGTCKDEVPDLERLHRTLKSKGFSVLALSVDEGGRKPVMSFVARFNPSFPVALSDRRTAEAYGVYGLPASFLIDADGVLRRRYSGPINEAAVENDILKLISKGEGKGT